MSKIIILAQNNDTIAKMLQQTLQGYFGKETVMLGLEGVLDIRQAISTAKAILVLIDADWASGAWISDDQHPTRIAIETALSTRKPLLMVSVDGSPMPTSQQLPESLMPIAEKIPLRLRSKQFRSDSIEIANLLEGFFTLGDEIASPFTAKVSPKTQVKLAEGWQRVLAYAIDNFILNAVFVILFQLGRVDIINNATSQQEAQTMVIFYVLIALAIYLGYQIISGAYGGQTFGKIIVGIRVIRQNGQPLRLSDATLRAFGYLLSNMSIWAGFLWALMDEKRQGWHDKIAKTLVIKIR